MSVGIERMGSLGRIVNSTPVEHITLSAPAPLITTVNVGERGDRIDGTAARGSDVDREQLPHVNNGDVPSASQGTVGWSQLLAARDGILRTSSSHACGWGSAFRLSIP